LMPSLDAGRSIEAGRDEQREMKKSEALSADRRCSDVKS